MIALADLNQVAYDRRLAPLVTANDLAGLTLSQSALAADADLNHAMEFFHNFEGNTAAVVESSDNPRLVGMMERGELLSLVRAVQKRLKNA